MTQLQRGKTFEPSGVSGEAKAIMHVNIDPNENVWPLVPPGRSNADMMER